MQANIFLVLGGLIALYLLGTAIGYGITYEFTHDVALILIALVLCFVWYGYLNYNKNQIKDDRIRFIEKIVSGIIIAATIAAFSLK
jgi:hypothetical protein